MALSEAEDTIARPVATRIKWLIAACILISFSSFAWFLCTIYNFPAIVAMINIAYTALNTIFTLFQIPIYGDIFNPKKIPTARNRPEPFKLTRIQFGIIFALATFSMLVWNLSLCNTYHLNGWAVMVSVLWGGLACLWIIFKFFSKYIQHFVAFFKFSRLLSSLSHLFLSLKIVQNSRLVRFLSAHLQRLLYPNITLKPSLIFSNKMYRQFSTIYAQTFLIAILLIGSGGWHIYLSHIADACDGLAGLDAGIGAEVIGNECVGISNGSVPFDIYRRDGQQKIQAAHYFRQGNLSAALGELEQATYDDPTDAEALIYKYDMLISQNMGHVAHITSTVDVTLTGQYIANGREVLQGAFIAQYEQYNLCQSPLHPHCVYLYLLIANTGSGYDQESDNAAAIGYQMLQILDDRQSQKLPLNFVGIMDGLSSQSVINIHTILDQRADTLPMVISVATSDSLESDYGLFHIIPADKAEGDFAAAYIQNYLHSRKIAVLFRSENAYSNDLVDVFRNDELNKIVYIEGYQRDNNNSITTALSHALYHTPDLIYCACYSNEANVILKNLPKTGPLANIHVLGGDSLFELGNYDSSVQHDMYRLLFTALAYPAVPSSTSPAVYLNFYSDYTHFFDPQHASKSVSLDAGIMTAYDGTSVLITAATNAFITNNKDYTAKNLLLALHNITGSQAIQGVTGMISFDSNGDVSNKALFMLSFDGQGNVIYKDMCGEFSTISISSSSSMCQYNP